MILNRDTFQHQRWKMAHPIILSCTVLVLNNGQYKPSYLDLYMYNYQTMLSLIIRPLRHDTVIANIQETQGIGTLAATEFLLLILQASFGVKKL